MTCRHGLSRSKPATREQVRAGTRCGRQSKERDAASTLVPQHCAACHDTRAGAPWNAARPSIDGEPRREPAGAPAVRGVPRRASRCALERCAAVNRRRAATRARWRRSGASRCALERCAALDRRRAATRARWRRSGARHATTRARSRLPTQTGVARTEGDPRRRGAVGREQCAASARGTTRTPGLGCATTRALACWRWSGVRIERGWSRRRAAGRSWGVSGDAARVDALA